MAKNKPKSWAEYGLQRINAAIEDKDKARACVRDSSIVGGNLVNLEVELNRVRFALEQIIKGADYSGD
jgi:hypothetical protein